MMFSPNLVKIFERGKSLKAYFQRDFPFFINNVCGFKVNEYPTASFELTGITEENGQQKLQGNLTIKEDTKNIEFPVTTSIQGDELRIESETFTLDRTDWDVNYGSKSVFDNLGNNFISDDMEISIHVQASLVE